MSACSLFSSSSFLSADHVGSIVRRGSGQRFLLSSEPPFSNGDEVIRPRNQDGLRPAVRRTRMTRSSRSRDQCLRLRVDPRIANLSRCLVVRTAPGVMVGSGRMPEIRPRLAQPASAPPRQKPLESPRTAASASDGPHLPPGRPKAVPGGSRARWRGPSRPSFPGRCLRGCRLSATSRIPARAMRAARLRAAPPARSSRGISRSISSSSSAASSLSLGEFVKRFLQLVAL